VGAETNSEKKISRTRWIYSIRIRLKFGFCYMQYINTDAEKYGGFTECPIRGSAYRYVANSIVDDIEADPDAEEAVPPDCLITGGPSVDNLATHRWHRKGLPDAATEAGLIQRIKDGARTHISKPHPREDDQRAFRELLCAFHGSIVSDASKYIPKGQWSRRLPKDCKHTRDQVFEDLVSVGCLALWQAALNFDLSRGCRFHTFARHRIKGVIRNEANYLRRRGFSDGNTIGRYLAKIVSERSETRISRWIFNHLGSTPEELIEVQKKLVKRQTFHSLKEAASAIKEAQNLDHCEAYSVGSDRSDIERGWALAESEDDSCPRSTKPVEEWRDLYHSHDPDRWSPQLGTHRKASAMIDFWINEFCCPPRIKSKPQPKPVYSPCLVKPTGRLLHPIDKPYWMEPRDKRPNVRAGLLYSRDMREVATVRFKNGKTRHIYRQMAANPGRHIQVNEAKGKQNHVRSNREQAIGGATAEIVVFQSRGSSVEGLHVG
jgi:hypothetical protein